MYKPSFLPKSIYIKCFKANETRSAVLSRESQGGHVFLYKFYIRI